MNYNNIDFLIAALVFLVFILVHYLMWERGKNESVNRVFIFFVSLGTLDVAAEILVTLLIQSASPELDELLFLMATVFLTIQTLFPYTLYMYAVYLRSSEELSISELVKKHWYALLGPAIMFGLLYSTYWSELIFSISPTGVYQPGEFIYAYYAYAVFYGLLMLADILLHREEYGPTKVRALLEYALIMLVSVIAQLFTAPVLIIGFGISLGIGVLFFTINNPHLLRDNFTGAYDAQYFHSWLNHAYRQKTEFHVISIDFMKLSKVNKLYGITKGDLLMQHIMKKLQEFSPTGLIFRIKGSRFILVVQSLPHYEELGKRLSDLFNKPFQIGEKEIPFPVIICGIRDAHSLEKSDLLFAYIDYLASLPKKAEETVVLQGNQRTLSNCLYELEVESFLPTAMEQNLFEVYYQPIYSLDEDAYVSLEALSRLRHPTLGLIPPDIFISIAERHGWIARISLLQFEHICAFFKEHSELRNRFTSVKFNLSPVELLREGHCNLLAELIRKYELPANFFQMEITETVATKCNEVLMRELGVLLNMGVTLNLDDFGSGYANLNVVRQMPFTYIKIDRSLLLSIDKDEGAAKFYQNIVDLLHNMGYIIVAEGVEYQSELNLLKEWGVNLIQGYYYMKPLEERALLEFYENL